MLVMKFGISTTVNYLKLLVNFMVHEWCVDKLEIDEKIEKVVSKEDYHHK